MTEKLVLKLPKGKPPFIGVLFIDSMYGAELHAEIVELHLLKEFRLDIEWLPHSLNLRLICAEIVKVYFYNDLYFEREELESWLYVARDAEEINFGHVSQSGGTVSIIRSKNDKKKFFVKVAGGLKLLKTKEWEGNKMRTSYRKW